MNNIQKQMSDLFGGSCYGYCMAYLCGRRDIKELTNAFLMGWTNGAIDDDGFVSKPLKYMQLLGFTYRDVVKEYNINDIYGPTIVEWECPSGGSHFTVENSATIKTDKALFDPSGNSNSRQAKKFISYRRYVR